MAFSTVVMLLDSQDTVLIETRARHWDNSALTLVLGDVQWVDISQNPGYSDYVTDLDAAAALRLYEYFLPGYRQWIAMNEQNAANHRRKGEAIAEEYAMVVDADKAQLAALTEIVQRAGAAGLKVRILSEEWSSGY